MISELSIFMDWTLLFIGFVGGTVRGLTGFIKHQLSYKDVKFNLTYFFLMVFLSGVIGMLVSSFLGGDYILCFVVGYAGGDFIENIYKIFAKSWTSS